MAGAIFYGSAPPLPRREVYNTRYAQMWPVDQGGRFDYGQPRHSPFGFDIREPLHRNEVYPLGKRCRCLGPCACF